MKSLLLNSRTTMVLAAAVVCFTAGRLSIQLPASAEEVGDAGSKSLPPCQDINGDGQSDVSDAVFFLQWRFLGGPEPVCATTNGPSSGLPDTGQTTCYDESGDVVDCTSDTCAGQDALHASGCSMEGRFVDNGDGTVTDTCTGLMWQKEAADANGDRTTNGDGLSWCDALAYCEDLELAGHDDWRLPNIRELESLVDYSRTQPAINPLFSTPPSSRPAPQYKYWSSTSFKPSGADHAWCLDFRDGNTTDAFKAIDESLTRAVRGGP